MGRARAAGSAFSSRFWPAVTTRRAPSPATTGRAKCKGKEKDKGDGTDAANTAVVTNAVGGLGDWGRHSEGPRSRCLEHGSVGFRRRTQAVQVFNVAVKELIQSRRDGWRRGPWAICKNEHAVQAMGVETKRRDGIHMDSFKPPFKRFEMRCICETKLA